ncbi:DUF222 domain-containing protein [Leifsonia sp. A12D58]|uniref:HNH endonuclease signature motif containing protein n=1 Tax=Leifsonia sp. A12D58 TaxID=3397674 RepID=UPI0039E09328
MTLLSEKPSAHSTALPLVVALKQARSLVAAALADSSLPLLADDDALAVLAEAEALGHMTDAARVAAATDVERRSARWLGKDSLARKRGCRNGRDLIVEVTRISGREVARRLKLGVQVLPRYELTQVLPPLFPLVADAFFAGELGVDAAEAIVTGLGEIRSRVDPDLLDVAEDALVAAATGMVTETTAGMPNAGFAFDADSIRGQVAVWVARLDPDGAAPNDDIYEARSHFSFGSLRNGLYSLHGGVTPEMRGIIDGVTNPFLAAHAPLPGNGGLLPDAHLADPGHPVDPDDLADPDDLTGRSPAFPSLSEQAAEAEQQARIDSGELPEAPIPFDGRTAAEKRADVLRGLYDAAARDPHAPTIGGSAPTVMEHVNARDLADENGVGWIDGVEAPVSLRTVQRMICAGGYQKIVFSDNNEVLYLGRVERIFNRQQRRAMAARDGGCAIPGCDTPPAWTEAHHVIPWQSNGKTDINNGVLLCWYHHHSLETSGWQIRMVKGAPQIKAPPWLDPEQLWRPGGQHRATQHTLTGL